mmetsp:Transcript_27613/g.66534  ORF Transcript_27613/g.66534 Transcript_27613/m.66534 type:complete len:107 (+) Transcript_27613:1049-1369(+)
MATTHQEGMLLAWVRWIGVVDDRTAAAGGKDTAWLAASAVVSGHLTSPLADDCAVYPVWPCLGPGARRLSTAHSSARRTPVAVFFIVVNGLGTAPWSAGRAMRLLL